MHHLITALAFLLIPLLSHSQSRETSGFPDNCEVFRKKGPTDKIKRFKALKEMEGDSVAVCILNRKGEVTKVVKGFVANLSSDIVRRGNLHTILMLGERKKNGKVARTQYSTIDPDTRIYLLECE